MQPDLCDLIIAEMQRLEFDPSIIELIKQNHCFIEAQGKTPEMQKVHLTRLFHRVLMTSITTPPNEIRLALAMATDWLGWSEDMKLTVLPFIRVNVEKFFIQPLANF